MSEVKLLPLPKVLLNVNIEAAAYARANVAHAVAPLQAEVEALRAEVELLRRGIVPRDDDMIVPVKLLDEINASGAEWKDRAKRLAEALREAYGQVRELCDAHAHPYPEASFARYEAALRPIAMQEGEESFWPKLPDSGGPDWTGHD